MIVCIAPITKRDDPEITTHQKAFLDRLIHAVILSKHSQFPNNGKSLELNAMDYLYKNNSITRQNVLHIEGSCIISSYPHRNDYFQMRCGIDDVSLHIQKDAGLNIVVLNYPTLQQKKTDCSILLKWKEVSSIEMYVEHRCGDPRPKIELSARQQVHLYADEMSNHLEQVKNDQRLTLELAYAFE